MERKPAFLFPGQGAQEVGMGRDLFGSNPFADELAEVASRASGLDIKKLCIRGPSRALAETRALQPALATVCLSYWHLLKENGVKASATAGHSVGELPALVAGGMVEPAQVIEVAAIRGRLMSEAALASPGGMMAVTGAHFEAVEEKIGPLKEKGVIGVAAVNAPNQMTLSGDRDLLDEALRELKQIAGARITPLRVSGAWHSKHMAPVVGPVRQALLKLPLKPESVPVVFNRAGREITDVSQVATFISEQSIKPVRWDLVMQRLLELGVTDFVEIGPGRVLRGLVRLNTEDPSITVHNVTDVRSADRTLKTLVS